MADDKSTNATIPPALGRFAPMDELGRVIDHKIETIARSSSLRGFGNPDVVLEWSSAGARLRDTATGARLYERLGDEYCIGSIPEHWPDAARETFERLYARSRLRR